MSENTTSTQTIQMDTVLEDMTDTEFVTLVRNTYQVAARKVGEANGWPIFEFTGERANLVQLLEGQYDAGKSTEPATFWLDGE